MKKKIVIIGAGCFQKALIEKAGEMGLETHVFAWEEGAEGKSVADYFYPVSIAEKERILEYCKEIKPDGVVTIASELANITVQYLTEQLGLLGNTAHCVRITTNKAEMRKQLTMKGIDCPDFWVIKEKDVECFEAPVSYPLIVKPTDRSGSRGVRKVENDMQLKVAVQEAIKHSFEKKAIVEKWIEGKEFSCECLSWQGRHYCMAITQKYTTGSPEFVETGHMEPAKLENEDEIIKEVFRVLDALEIQNGASHTEFRIDGNGRFHLIEAGSRMGGDCIGSDLVRLSMGMDYVKAVIQISLGETPDMSCGSHYKAAAIKFILDDSDRALLQRVRENQSLHIIYESVDKKQMEMVTDSSARSGYFIFVANEYGIIKEIMESVE